MIDQRGYGRRLTAADFGAGKIDKLSILDFGPFWQKIHAAAAYRLNAFLKEIPYKFQITSSYRTPKQNKADGGAANSRHLTGDAFDVWIYDPDFFDRDRLKHYVSLAKASGFNGVGIYKNKSFLHVDVRNKLHTWAGIHTVKAGKKSLEFIPFARALQTFTKKAAPGMTGAAFLALLLYLILRRR